MKITDAVFQVLQDHGLPMHYRTITQSIIDQNLWTPGGPTPDRTVNSMLNTEIQKHGEDSTFVRVGDGVYGLRAWNNPPKPPEQPTATDIVDDHQYLSFTDAAERVLENFANNSPMHYREITRLALENKLVRTSGLTPEATLYAQVLTETKRRNSRGEKPRFVMFGEGMIGLNSWLGDDLIRQVHEHNKKIRKKLKEKLMGMTAGEFQDFIKLLLETLGFEDVVVSRLTNDGGIDVRGTLVVGEVIKTKMAIQAKKWRNNVQSPVVQQVRGSLGMHEHGLIITTASFSAGAIKEASRENAVPIALMNGDQLVSLLIEHEIGVRPSPDQLLILAE